MGLKIIIIAMSILEIVSARTLASTDRNLERDSTRNCPHLRKDPLSTTHEPNKTNRSMASIQNYIRNKSMGTP